MTDGFWTDETKQRLLDLWGAGLSGTQVASELGITRNAVLGQIHRLGIKRGRIKPKDTLIAAPKRANDSPPPERRYTLPPKPAAPPPPVKATDLGWPKPMTATAVRFLDRTRLHCAMILDSETPIERRMVCGAPVVPERSWCPACLKSIVGSGSIADYQAARVAKGGRFN